MMAVGGTGMLRGTQLCLCTAALTRDGGNSGHWQDSPLQGSWMVFPSGVVEPGPDFMVFLSFYIQIYLGICQWPCYIFLQQESLALL